MKVELGQPSGEKENASLGGSAHSAPSGKTWTSTETNDPKCKHRVSESTREARMTDTLEEKVVWAVELSKVWG